MISIVAAPDLEMTPAARRAVLVPWIHAAGTPYLDRLFDDAAGARACLTTWLEQPGSEVWWGRSRLALDARRRVVGGYLALSGHDLMRCRQRDALALLTTGPAEHRQRRRQFLASTAALFAPVPTEAEYLSKIGVLEGFQRQRVATALLDDWLDRAHRRGVAELRLDVAAGNVAALALYQRFGFTPCHRGDCPDEGLCYLSMVHRPTFR